MNNKETTQTKVNSDVIKQAVKEKTAQINGSKIIQK